MSQNATINPIPKYIEGGCLCSRMRYRIDFPTDHDFAASSSTCQCTTCRKNLSSLFLASHTVKPASCFQWATSTSTLKEYRASAAASRPFCGECGSVIYYKPDDGDYVSIAVGTVDALYLFGEGADGVGVPKEGFGRALVNGLGPNLWCKNEIKGVTDDIPLLNRAERLEEE